MAQSLASWTDTPTREAIVSFAERAAGRLPEEERVAVFDNDGTLWCEKPIPIQLDFILRRFVELAEQDESLRVRQPWKASYEHDMDWLGQAIVKHYNGDDSDVKLLVGAVANAFTELSVEEYQRSAADFIANRIIRRSGAPTAVARSCRWSSCCATSKAPASPR